MSSARNLGLDNAKGENIFIYPDDYVCVDYSYELYSTLDKYNADFVATVEYKVGVANKTTYIVSDEFCLLFTVYKFDKSTGPVSKLFKKSIITENDIRFKLKVHSGEDSIFVYQYLLSIKDIVLIFSDKYYYDKTRSNSLSKTTPSYDSTLLEMQEFDRTFALMKTKMKLDAESIRNLNRTLIAFTDKVLMSIVKNPSRKVGVKKLEELNWDFYLQNKVSGIWKETFMVYLLNRRLYSLYVYLMSLRFK